MTLVNATTEPIEIFYDGRCGLCQREIRYYQRIAPRYRFRFTDVTKETERLSPYGLSLDAALRKFYVADVEGNLHAGVDAFIVIWRELFGWRWLAKFVNLSLVKPCARLLYRYFAAWRYRRNGYGRCLL